MRRDDLHMPPTFLQLMRERRTHRGNAGRLRLVVVAPELKVAPHRCYLFETVRSNGSGERGASPVKVSDEGKPVVPRKATINAMTQ
jgi:hypothetical protein